MALTGPADGDPLGPPAGLVPGVLELGDRITAATASLGTAVALDWLALLGERAALAGLTRHGSTSCGGSTRLLPVEGGWLAACLAREVDHDLLPAWLAIEVPSGDPWPTVTAAVAAQRSAALVDRAALLGLPVAALGERSADPSGGVRAIALGEPSVDGSRDASTVALGEPSPHGPRGASAIAPAAEPTAVASLDDLLVLDLSSLWAGPLCASLLGLGGAAVVKVESTARPDGARRTGDGLFDLLNGGKRSVALDLATPGGAAVLASLIRAADVVVESSRPRALEQLGIVAADELAEPDGPRVWVSITGHGRSTSRVAFGDDAAVAGGLVVRDVDGPCFCADAVGDPVTALAATAAALEALAAGGRWLVDVAMAGVTASLAGPTLPAASVPASPPRARPVREQARPLGADTATVLAAL